MTPRPVNRARALRRRQTDAERRLWYRLRNRQLEGAKFRRQLPIGPYVADFACRRARLVVEVDGGQHGECRRDIVRTAFLNTHGFRVLRFWNHDVMRDVESVLETIRIALIEREGPSPGTRGSASAFAKASADGPPSAGSGLSHRERRNGTEPDEITSPSGEVGPALAPVRVRGLFRTGMEQ